MPWRTSMGQLEGSSQPTNPWPALDGPGALQQHSCAFGLPQPEDTLLISANRLAIDLAERPVFPENGNVAETTRDRPCASR